MYYDDGDVYYDGYDDDYDIDPREPYLGTYDDEREELEDWDCRERIGFADPGGNSALRAAHLRRAKYVDSR